MVPDSNDPILEPVFAAIHGTLGLGDIPVRAGDSLKDIGLSRLRLLATLIELEDKFDIEFPADAVTCFRVVGDIALYIQSHAMLLCDDLGARPAAQVTQSTGARPSATVCSQLCARAFGRMFGVAAPAAG